MPVLMCVLGPVVSCYCYAVPGMTDSNQSYPHYNRHAATSIKLNLVTEVKTNIVSP